MASPIESLPTELADLIFGEMRLEDISRLMQCNSSLQKSLEPRLYCSMDARNQAMFWACTHNHPRVIQTLITRYDTSATTVEIPARSPESAITNPSGPSADGSPTVKILTLNLVVRLRNVEAFEILLRMGARVNDCDPMVSPYQPWFLLRRLCRPPQRNLLVRLLDTVARSQISLTGPQLNRMLILLITSDAPLHLITRVLDLGASPDSCHPYVSHNVVCALSAAILRNSASLFSLLVERGANIHGVNHRVIPVIPLQHPVFAAAHVLPKSGPAMIKMCLEQGADINQCAQVRASNVQNRCTTTPIDIFLRSIRTWLPSETEIGGESLNPVEGLRYLLDNGASLDRHPEDFRLYVQNGQEYLCRPSSIEILLRRWGAKKLADPQFTAVIELLVETGALEKQDNRVAVRILKKARRSAAPNETTLLDSMIAMLGGSDVPEPGFLWKALSRAFPVLTVHDR